jgi:hypothetical protein
VFNPNVSPKDTAGELVREGLYEVHKQGQKALRASVFSDDELTLWVRFDGAERPQRLDEISLFCEWIRLEAVAR